MSQLATLTTPRLTLRKPVAADWDAFRGFFMSNRSETLGGPMSEGVAWRTFASELGHWEINGFGMWAVTVTGTDKAVGLIGPWSPIDWPENEIGWMIFDPATEGTGIAKEAAAAAIADARATLGWDEVVSYISPTNIRSVALAKKLGAYADTNAIAPAAYPDAVVYRHPKDTA